MGRKMKVTVGDFRIAQEERKVINEVLDSGRISEGRKAREFEKRFAEYIGTRYAVITSSGTGALITGLMALIGLKGSKIRKAKKVITTPLTYVSTVNAIVLAGLEPVFVDVDKYTFSISPETIRSCLKEAENSEEYSLIVPVHLMGYPCDMDGINSVAEEYGLFVLEDSAQAHGSLYKGKKTGSLSHLSAFSFYIAHNIQAGEMGAITTDDAELAKLIRQLKANGRICNCPVCMRSQGRCPRLFTDNDNDDNDPRFTHELIGYNFKAMEFQAALGIAQLEKANWIFKKRQENVYNLNQKLERYKNFLRLPAYSPDVSYLAYPIIIKKTQVISRKILRKKLEENGIETRPLFGCIPTQQPAYSYLKDRYETKLPNADYIGKHGFYIGCHQYLEEEDLDYVAEVFDKVLKGYL